jgi:hypothetical protein
MKYIKLFEELELYDYDGELNKFLEQHKVDIYDFSIDFLQSIGFQKYGPILLIPLQYFNKIKNGTEVISILGNKKIVGKDYIDDDTKGGLMAFGLDLYKMNISKPEDYDKNIEWID